MDAMDAKKAVQMSGVIGWLVAQDWCAHHGLMVSVCVRVCVVVMWLCALFCSVCGEREMSFVCTAYMYIICVCV